MPRLIIGFFLILIIVAIVMSWFLSGASQEIERRGAFFTNPFTIAPGFEGTSTLPYYPIPDIVPIDISDRLGETEVSAGDFDTYDFGSGATVSDSIFSRELADLESEYETLRKTLSEAQTFGDPSPYRDMVQFTYSDNARLSDPREEYVAIEARESNAETINITGWSLQSVVSGVRVYVPRGVRVFEQGTVGTFSDIYLDPGSVAYLVTGVSPIGVSFRENVCTGYLSQFQSFTPELDLACPLPRTEVPATADAIQVYGDVCFDFLNSMDQCRFHFGPLPQSLPSACAQLIRNAFTYNGCVSKNRWRPSFSLPTWRVYLGQNTHMWRDSREVLRLLDASGRTVDVWSY